MMLWMSRDAGTGDSFYNSQSHSTGSRFSAFWTDANHTSKYATNRASGNSASALQATDNITSTLKLAVVTFTSTTTWDVYFGDNTAYPNSGTTIDETSQHDLCVIGALHYASVAPFNFANGKVAEAHWFNTALTPTQITGLLTDTVKPEATAGWVDGWTFKTYNSGGTYTSIGGSRTMTAVGGVTDAGVHPISRTVPDTTAPTMNGSITSSSITSTGFTLSWIAASDDTAVTGYEYSTDAGTTYLDAGNVLTKAVTGLAPSTLYNTRVRAYDAAANKATPLSLAVTTSAAPDVTVPTMNGSLTSSSVTSGGFTLNWPAASDNVAVTGYEYSIDNGSTYSDVGNVLTKAVTGLTASTLYNTKVRAYDAAGNRATPLSLAVTTSASSDVTLPVLAGSITSSAITLTGFTISWPAGSDNVAVTGYEYSINGGSTYADAGNVLTKAITGLTQSTAYAVRVRAYDAAGNRSTPALSASVTTASPTLGTIPALSLGNNTASPWASQTNVTVLIQTVAGSLVLTKTGLTTSSTGLLAAISDALISPTTVYRVIPIVDSGDEGSIKVTAQ
jgi:chitodextrinase